MVTKAGIEVKFPNLGAMAHPTVSVLRKKKKKELKRKMSSAHMGGGRQEVIPLVKQKSSKLP